jgi:hypothetical protein
MGPGHACSAETEGKTSPVFYAKLLASAVLLGSCVQRKTVRHAVAFAFLIVKRHAVTWQPQL